MECVPDEADYSRDVLRAGSLRPRPKSLVSLGRRGLEVVRLKGGDPFVFGRGGEEALALAEARVPFEIVPGVSSLAAVPAGSGIPITHRGVSSLVTIVSGHDPAELDFDGLAKAPGTLVVFMGLAALETIAERLIAAGKAPDTPAGPDGGRRLEPRCRRCQTRRRNCQPH